MTIIEGLKEKKMTVLGQTAALQQFFFFIEDLPLNSQSAWAFRRPAGAPAACLPAWSTAVLLFEINNMGKLIDSLWLKIEAPW